MVCGLCRRSESFCIQLRVCVCVSRPLHPLLSLCLSQTGRDTSSFLCAASQVLPLQSYTARRFIIAACNAHVSKRQYHAMWRIFIWGLTLLHWIGKVHFFKILIILNNSCDFYLLLNSDLQILASLNHNLLSQYCNGCDVLIENMGM